MNTDRLVEALQQDFIAVPRVLEQGLDLPAGIERLDLAEQAQHTTQRRLASGPA